MQLWCWSLNSVFADDFNPKQIHLNLVLRHGTWTLTAMYAFVETAWLYISTNSSLFCFCLQSGDAWSTLSLLPTLFTAPPLRVVPRPPYSSTTPCFADLWLCLVQPHCRWFPVSAGERFLLQCLLCFQFATDSPGGTKQRLRSLISPDKMNVSWLLFFVRGVVVVGFSICESLQCVIVDSKKVSSLSSSEN